MIPIDVRRDVLDVNGVTSVIPVPPGLSGAALFRCESQSPLALKRWPNQTPRKRIETIHSIQRPLSASCQWVPKLQNLAHPDASLFVDSRGCIWELASWMPGTALDYDAPVRSIRAGGQALAIVHHHMRAFGAWGGQAAAITERIERIGVLNRTLPRCWQIDPNRQVHPDVVRSLIRATSLLRSHWPEASSQSLAQLSRRRSDSYFCQYVLRDIHRDHLLFEGDSPSGLVDFDAMRIDTPAVDLARWVSSFAAFARDPVQVVDETLAGYREASTLKRREPNTSNPADLAMFSPHGGGVDRASDSDFRTLILELSRSSLWISLANWVVWLLDDQKRFPDHEIVELRIRRLVDTIHRTRQR